MTVNRLKSLGRFAIPVILGGITAFGLYWLSDGVTSGDALVWAGERWGLEIAVGVALAIVTIAVHEILKWRWKGYTVDDELNAFFRRDNPLPYIFFAFLLLGAAFDQFFG